MGNIGAAGQPGATASGGGATDAPSSLFGSILGGLGALLGGIGGAKASSSAGKASQSQTQIAQQQMAMQQQIHDILLPLFPAYAQNQLWQQGLGQQMMGQLLPYTMNRLGGQQGVAQTLVPSMQPQQGSAGVATQQAQKATQKQGLDTIPDPIGEFQADIAATLAGEGQPPHRSFAGRDPNWGGQQQQPSPAPASPTTPEPAAPQDPGLPAIEFGGLPSSGQFSGGMGPFSMGPELMAAERARTRMEMGWDQAMGDLMLSLGSQFGSPGAAGSLLGGAASELATQRATASQNAQLDIFGQQQGVEQGRYADAMGLLGGMMGLDLGPAAYAMQNVNAGMANAGNLFGQTAQFQQGQANQMFQGLAGLGQMFGQQSQPMAQLNMPQQLPMPAGGYMQAPQTGLPFGMPQAPQGMMWNPVQGMPGGWTQGQSF